MNTDELISHGRARFEHAAAKRLLKETKQATKPTEPKNDGK